MARSKGWSSAARRNARKYASVLRAMAKRPEDHLEEIFGTRNIRPETVIKALRLCNTRRALNWRLSWAWDWRVLLERNLNLWPDDSKADDWHRVWAEYEARFGRCEGPERKLER